MTEFSAFMHLTRKQLTRGFSLKTYKIICKIKKKENENKIILGDFDCAMDKMKRDGGNKIQRSYTCPSNHTLS